MACETSTRFLFQSDSSALLQLRRANLLYFAGRVYMYLPIHELWSTRKDLRVSVRLGNGLDVANYNNLPTPPTTRYDQPKEKPHRGLSMFHINLTLSRVSFVNGFSLELWVHWRTFEDSRTSRSCYYHMWMGWSWPLSVDGFCHGLTLLVW